MYLSKPDRHFSPFVISLITKKKFLLYLKQSFFQIESFIMSALSYLPLSLLPGTIIFSYLPDDYYDGKLTRVRDTIY